MVVPEVSTILSEGGAAYPGMAAGKQLVDFETSLLKLQVSSACVCFLAQMRPIHP
jgi:hypothetical protein